MNSSIGQEMTFNRFQGEIKPFDVALSTIPQFIIDCPVVCEWLEYKGETYFGILDYERSLKAKKPMIALSYCATRAMNGCVLKTVQYDKKHFKTSRLATKQE